MSTSSLHPWTKRSPKLLWYDSVFISDDSVFVSDNPVFFNIFGCLLLRLSCLTIHNHTQRRQSHTLPHANASKQYTHTHTLSLSLFLSLSRCLSSSPFSSERSTSAHPHLLLSIPRSPASLFPPQVFGYRTPKGHYRLDLTYTLTPAWG